MEFKDVDGAMPIVWQDHCFKSAGPEGSLVQWLRLCLPMQGVQVPSLVGKLRSQVSIAKKTKHKLEQYC